MRTLRCWTPNPRRARYATRRTFPGSCMSCSRPPILAAVFASRSCRFIRRRAWSGMLCFCRRWSATRGRMIRVCCTGVCGAAVSRSFFCWGRWKLQERKRGKVGHHRRISARHCRRLFTRRVEAPVLCCRHARAKAALSLGCGAGGRQPDANSILRCSGMCRGCSRSLRLPAEYRRAARKQTEKPAPELLLRRLPSTFVAPPMPEALHWSSAQQAKLPKRNIASSGSAIFCRASAWSRIVFCSASPWKAHRIGMPGVLALGETGNFGRAAACRSDARRTGAGNCACIGGAEQDARQMSGAAGCFRRTPSIAVSLRCRR